MTDDRIIRQIFDAGERKIDGKVRPCKLLFHFDESGNVFHVETDPNDQWEGPTMPIPFTTFREYRKFAKKRPMLPEERYQAHLDAVRRHRERKKQGIRIRGPYQRKSA